MNKLLILPFILLLLPLSIILFNGFKKPQPISFEGQTAQILTRTAMTNLYSSEGWLNLLFSESRSNPYTYGWKGSELYFKTADGKNFVYFADEQKQEPIAVENPQFLRQERTARICNRTNGPTYTIENFSAMAVDLCYVIAHGNTKVEAWPYELGELLAIDIRHLVISKGEHKAPIHEPRIISDLVISEDEKYLAVTASDPQSHPNGSAATDIHVIELW